MPIQFCICGRPLHYTRPEREAEIQHLVDVLGEYVVVVTPNGAWEVPRHYIALHGIVTETIPYWARIFEWKKVDANGI